MNLFAGLSRTDYEDLFRAVGALIDERGWTNVSLTEVDEGLVVQVLIKPDLRDTYPHLETYLLTDNDLERVMGEAIMRRRRKADAPPAESGQRRPLLTPTPDPDPAIVPAARNLPPPPSGIVRGHMAAKAAQGQRPLPAVADNAALPPLPPLDLPGSAPQEDRSLSALWDEPVAPPLAPAEADDLDELFAPAPMRLSATPAPPPPPAFDLGAARAAVVMAHIVAARLKSGMPMTGDDPDLASLLDQVRALDETGIGRD